MNKNKEIQKGINTMSLWNIYFTKFSQKFVKNLKRYYLTSKGVYLSIPL